MHRANEATKPFIQEFVYEARNDRISAMFLFGATLLFSLGVLLMVGAVLYWSNNSYHYFLWVGLAMSIISIFLIKIIMNLYPVSKDVHILKDE